MLTALVMLQAASGNGDARYALVVAVVCFLLVELREVHP